MRVAYAEAAKCAGVLPSLSTQSTWQPRSSKNVTDSVLERQVVSRSGEATARERESNIRSREGSQVEGLDAVLVGLLQVGILVGHPGEGRWTVGEYGDVCDRTAPAIGVRQLGTVLEALAHALEVATEDGSVKRRQAIGAVGVARALTVVDQQANALDGTLAAGIMESRAVALVGHLDVALHSKRGEYSTDTVPQRKREREREEREREAHTSQV